MHPNSLKLQPRKKRCFVLESLVGIIRYNIGYSLSLFEICVGTVIPISYHPFLLFSVIVPGFHCQLPFWIYLEKKASHVILSVRTIQNLSFTIEKGMFSQW